MAQLTIPQAELDLLKTKLQALNVAPQRGAPDINTFEKDFCSVWPEVKKVIEAISPWLGWVPYAQTALKLLDEAGTSLSNAVCTKP